MKRYTGFTLIELSVVLLILILISGFVIPNIGFFIKEDIREVARDLRGYLMGLRSEAVFSQRLIRLHIDFKDLVFFADECIPQGGDVCEWQEMKGNGTKFKITNGVEMEDVIVSGEKVRSGELLIPFSIRGTAVPFDIHIKKRDKFFTLSMNPFSGDVDAIEGYIEKFIYEEED